LDVLDVSFFVFVDDDVVDVVVVRVDLVVIVGVVAVLVGIFC
jgi:hypothetical protein